VTNRYHEQSHAGNLRRMPRTRTASTVVKARATTGYLPGADSIGPALGLGSAPMAWPAPPVRLLSDAQPASGGLPRGGDAGVRRG
jgi:hypothetical protein